MPVGRESPGPIAHVPKEGKIHVPIPAANGPAHPALGSRPADGCLVGLLLHELRGLRARLRLPQHLAAAPDRLVVRVPDLALAAGEVGKGQRRGGYGKGPHPHDPIPGEFAPASCLDPPSEEEIWEKVPKFKNGWPVFYETQRNNARILIEKIGEKVDPCKVYPLAGPCQLVHCHYKCSVYFDESYWSDYPIPFNHRKARVEVVFFDKDHLRLAAAARPRRCSRQP